MIHHKRVYILYKLICLFIVQHCSGMKRTAIITGGSRGLGRELINLFLKEGWKVATFSRHEAQSVEYVEPSLLKFRADLRLEADVERIISETERLLGPPSLLVLNAGTVSRATRVVDENIMNLRADIEVNLIANTFILQEFLRRYSSGTVVHITSDVASSPFPGWGFYGASKRAMDYIIDTLRFETPDSTFLSIDPGDMDTDMHRIADPEADPNSLARPQDAALKVYSRIMDMVR